MAKKLTVEKSTLFDKSTLKKSKKRPKDKPLKTVRTLLNMGPLFEHRLIARDAVRHICGIEIFRVENLAIAEHNPDDEHAEPAAKLANRYSVRVRFTNETDARDAYTKQVSSKAEAVRQFRQVVAFFQKHGVVVEGEPLPEIEQEPSGPPEETAASPFATTAAIPE